MADDDQFLPPTVHRLLGVHAGHDSCTPLSGVALVADLVGFTAMVARHAADGKRGHGDVERLLQRSFAIVDGSIARHGGEVLQRAGDSSIALFTGPGDARAARAAAAEMLEAFGDDSVADMPEARIGLAAGDFDLLIATAAGHGYWTLLGEPVVDAARCQAGGSNGSVVEHPTMADATRNHRDASPSPAPLGRTPLAADRFAPRGLPPRDTVAEWMAELRPLSVCFGRITDESDRPLHRPGDVQRVVSAFGEAMATFGGSVDQVTQDDKGLLVLSVFGTRADPAPEHAARRAALSMLAGQHAVEAAGARLAGGLTTGLAIVGAIGGAGQTFAAIGPAVNLAARLAQLEGGQLHVDEHTARDVDRIVELEPVDVVLKGLGPTRALRMAPRPSGRLVRSRPVCHLGRDAEREKMALLVNDLLRGKAGAAAIVGEGGIGKSTLIAETVARAADAGLATMHVAGDPGVGPAPLRALAQTVREHSPQLTDDLEQLIGAGTSSLEPAQPTRIIEIVARWVTTHLLPRGSFVVVVHDAQWVDGLTLEVLAAALRLSGPHLAIVEIRPLPDLRSELTSMCEALSVDRLELSGLRRDEVAELISTRLGVSSVPQTTIDLVHEHSAGNPLFIEHLIDAALDAGDIVPVGDHVRLASGRGLLDVVDAPTDVRRLLAGRLDQLGRDASQLLKAAAVWGMWFDASELAAAGMTQRDPVATNAALDELVGRGLIVREHRSTRCRFGHAMTRDVAYAALTQSQVTALHAAAARYLESSDAATRSGADLVTHHWLLADDPGHALPGLTGAVQRAAGVWAGPDALRLIDLADELSRRHQVDVDGTTRAVWELARSQALRAMGDVEAAETSLTGALELVGLHVPTTRGEWLTTLLGAVARQAALRARRRPRRAHHDPRDATAIDALRVMHVTAIERDDVRLALFADLNAMNLAERARLTDEMVTSYAMAELGAASIGARRLAHRYGQLSRRAASHAAPRRGAELNVYHAIRLIGDGRLDAAARSLIDARDVFTGIGTDYAVDLIEAFLGYTELFGERLEDALLRYRRLTAAAAGRGDVRLAAWGSNGEAIALVALGRDAEARQRLTAGEDTPSDGVARLARICCLALLDARGDAPIERACLNVHAATTALLDVSATFTVLLVHFTFAAEAVRVAIERARREAPTEVAELRRLQARLQRRFWRFSRVFPVARATFATNAATTDNVVWRALGNRSLQRLHITAAFPSGRRLLLTDPEDHHAELPTSPV